MNLYNQSNYEYLIYYSLNTILRKGSLTFNEIASIQLNNITTNTNDLYKDIITGYTKDIYSLGYKVGVGKYGFSVDDIPTITNNPIFKLNSIPLTHITYIKYLSNVITTSATQVSDVYYTFDDISDYTYIKSDKWKCYNASDTEVSTIVEQNDTTNLNYTTDSYAELYEIYKNEFTFLVGISPITTRTITPDYYDISSVLPVYKTVGDNIKDIHNYVMQQYFLWGYYTGLNLKIKQELYTVNLNNVKCYEYDERLNDVYFTPDNKYFKNSTSDFTNFLIQKYQETLYLSEKYKLLYEKYNNYFYMAINDYMLGKTNYNIIKSNTTINPQTYKAISVQSSDLTDSNTFLWELLAIENYNRYYIPFLTENLSNNKTVIQPNALSTLISLITDNTPNKHFNLLFSSDATVDSANLFDLRRFTFLCGKTVLTKNYSKYSIINNENESKLVYNVSDNTYGADISSEFDSFSHDFISSLKKVIFQRISNLETWELNLTAWKSNITGDTDIFTIVKPSFISANGICDYMESKIGSKLSYSFKSSLILWNIINNYITQIILSDRNNIELNVIKDDEYNLSNIFTGYIMDVTDTIPPIVTPSNIDFLLKFYNYFNPYPTKDAIVYACHYILRCNNEFYTETFDEDKMSTMLNYVVSKLDSESNIKSITSVKSTDISSIVTNLTVE